MNHLIEVSYLFAIYSLLANSFNLLYSVSKSLYLTHAASITISAYFVYFATVVWKQTLWTSVFLSLFAVVFLMVVLYELIYNNMQKKGLLSWQIMIASLGGYVVLQNLVSLVWKDSILSFRTWEVNEGYTLLGAHITNLQIIIIFGCMALLGANCFFMKETHIGKQIKAVSSNTELSSILGLSKNKIICWSVGISTGLAACAGIMIAADNDMTPTMGFNWLLYAVVAMIIGGMGKMRHLFFGALLLATAQHFVAYYLDSKWMNAVAYLILIAFLYFCPSGFSGKQVKKNNI